MIRTASFKIWYPTVIDHRNAQLNLYTVEDVQAAALNVAATIQQDYNKLLGGVRLGAIVRCAVALQRR